jgi:hypothetical protein
VPEKFFTLSRDAKKLRRTFSYFRGARKPAAEFFHTFAGRENLPQNFFAFSRDAN